MKSKSQSQQDHAKRRFQERLGVKFSQYIRDMLLHKIRTNQFKFIVKQSNRVSVYEVTFTPRPQDMLYESPKEITVLIAYDKHRGNIVTVSAPGETFDSCAED